MPDRRKGSGLRPRARWRALAPAGQVDDVGGVAVADQGGDRPERLDLVHLGAAGVGGRDEDRGQERAAGFVGADDVEVRLRR